MRDSKNSIIARVVLKCATEPYYFNSNNIIHMYNNLLLTVTKVVLQLYFMYQSMKSYLGTDSLLSNWLTLYMAIAAPYSSFVLLPWFSMKMQRSQRI